MFQKKAQIEISEDLNQKIKKHCAANGIKVSQFVEEAIIEKMIQPHIKD